jgi:hypothetical protein
MGLSDNRFEADKDVDNFSGYGWALIVFQETVKDRNNRNR